MTVQLRVPISTPDDEVNDVVASQLSSPLQSYEIASEPDRVIIQHPQPYRGRFQSTKAAIEELRSEVKGLKDRQRQRDQTLIDWEIRSRIAQGLNDHHIQSVPEHALSRLKDKRFGFLPPSLATWASFHDIQIPALDRISDEDFHNYSVKGALIKHKGLDGDMASVWNSIPPVSRSLIICMWVSRSDSRNDVSHPTPTIGEGDQLVDTDPILTDQEVALAKHIIRTAVDRDGVPLFRNAESSMD